MSTEYVTVAIPFVNADPHLGYAYELVLADVHARASRLDGVAVRFLGGTDDYSLKNVLAADAAGIPVQEFVDRHAQRFEDLREPLDLSFDDFIRTSSDERHVPAVHRLWNAALANGDLYRRPYEGDYCVGCEQFLGPGELVDGTCPEHPRPLERVVEDNWFFRLSRYQDQLALLIESGELRVEPAAFRNEVLGFVRSGLDDISVSRSNERARGWGVPVPGDPTQVIYVWFDALANYISALDYGQRDGADYQAWWTGAESRVHVIGKGILRFHAVFWPAFLLAAGQPLPTLVRVHPYLTLGGTKLSKSSGASVDPTAIVAAYGTDVLRWWFCRDVADSADTEFHLRRLIDRANDDLAGGIGNAISRIVTIVHRHRGGVPPHPHAEPLAAVADLPARVRHLLRRFEHRAATQAIVDGVGTLNRDLEATAPWTLAKEPESADRLDVVLSVQLATARVIAEALAPITPALAERAIRQLTASPFLPPAEPLLARLETPPESAGPSN